jgi:hypothetical protein
MDRYTQNDIHTDGQAYIHNGRKINGQIDTQSKHAHTHTHRKVDRQVNMQRMIYRQMDRWAFKE